PSTAHEPRTAGHRHLSRRYVRPAHHRQTRPDYLPHQREDPRPLLRGPDRHQEKRATYPGGEADRLGTPPWDPGQHRGRRSLPEGTCLGGRVHRADHHRQSPRQAHVPQPGGRDEGVSPDVPRTPPRATRNKPHPYGIELGMLLKMLQDTKSHWLSGFLASDFSRVSPHLAEDICKAAKLSPRARPRDIHGEAAEGLYKAIQSTKIMAPPTNCLSP